MDKFLEAFINTKHRVLGQNLRPFCLAHLLYFIATDSPVLKMIFGEKVELSRRDIELAIWICSRTPEQIFSADVNAGFFRRMRMRIGNFKKAQIAFLAYLKDYATLPIMWEDEKESGMSLGSPWILTRATFLLKETNLTESQIWGMPFGKLFWYTASLCELMGGAKVMSDEEERAIDELRKVENGK